MRGIGKGGHIKKEQGYDETARAHKMLDFALLKRLAPYLRRHARLLAAAFALMVVFDTTGILHPYLLKVGIDRHVMAGDLAGLLAICRLLALVLVGNFIFSALFN